MRSAARREFWACFESLPERVQASARQAFELWQRNPRHPSLQFKKLHAKESVYSVRIGENWRALGLLREDTVC